MPARAVPVPHLARLAALALTGAFAMAQPALAQRACALDAPACCALPSPSAARPLALGVQAWPQDLRLRQDALAALRPAAIRYSAGPSWTRLPPLPTSVELDEARRVVRAAFAAEAERFAGEARDAREAVARTGAQAHLVIWAPPRTAAEPASDARPPKRTLPEEGLEATARFLLAVLEELRRRDYPTDVVELTNEPDGDWNLAIAPERYVRLVERVRALARQEGFALPAIAGPGVGSIAALRPYLAEDGLARRLLAAVDVVSVHGWDDRQGVDPVAESRRVRAALDRLGHRKPVALTELALTFLTPQDRAAGRGANGRAPDAVSDTAAYAGRTAQALLGLADAGFSPIILWELRDQDWGKASYGLLDRADRPRPSHSVIEGLGRAASGGVTGLVQALPGRAFLLMKGSEVVGATLVNASAVPVDIRITRAGALGPLLDRSSLSRLPRCAANDDGVGLVLPPHAVSIVTPD